jgi:hypothetical protein
MATGAFLAENFGLPNLEPNNRVRDGCSANDKPFTSAFACVASPNDGYRGGDDRAVRGAKG